MEKQGYKVKEAKFYQDNESAIKMEKNGLKSCGEKSRHIDIRYFFIKDISKQENITVEHCRTEEMIADFFTKPLQGSLFKRMRGIIMGTCKMPVEERVENNVVHSRITNELKQIREATSVLEDTNDNSPELVNTIGRKDTRKDVNASRKHKNRNTTWNDVKNVIRTNE